MGRLATALVTVSASSLAARRTTATAGRGGRCWPAGDWTVAPSRTAIGSVLPKDGTARVLRRPRCPRRVRPGPLCRSRSGSIRNASRSKLRQAQRAAESSRRASRSGGDSVACGRRRAASPSTGWPAAHSSGRGAKHGRRLPPRRGSAAAGRGRLRRSGCTEDGSRGIMHAHSPGEVCSLGAAVVGRGVGAKSVEASSSAERSVPSATINASKPVIV